jgi:hypothetical protein
MTASEQLAALDAEVARLRAKVNELDAAERTARRSLDRVRGPLLDYERECARRGEQPDPERVRELTADVMAVSPLVELRPAMANDPSTGVARFIGLDAIDTRAEARLEGARVGLREAQEAATAFVTGHAAELVREMAPKALAVRDQLVKALTDLHAAEAEWSGVFTRVARIGERSSTFTADDLPDDPLPREAAAEVAKAARTARARPDRFVPLPTSLAAGDVERAS